MCTRAMYVGDDGLVITGRSMDWGEDMSSNMWVFPRGMARDGASGADTVTWTSKYGSLVTSAYESATADGMNERGLVMNGLLSGRIPVRHDRRPADHVGDRRRTVCAGHVRHRGRGGGGHGRRHFPDHRPDPAQRA